MVEPSRKEGKTRRDERGPSANVSPAVFYRNNRSSILGNSPSNFRRALYDLVSSKGFSRVSLLIAVINTAFIMYEYFFNNSECKDKCVADSVPFLIFYTVEAMLKLVAYKGFFFWDPFNCLDLALAALQTASLLKNIMKVFVFPAMSSVRRTKLDFVFDVLSSLNALRIARLLRHLDTLRLQGRVILFCFKDIIYVCMYMVLVTYVAAAFAVSYDVQPTMREAWWSLFLMMTLDDWSTNFRANDTVNNYARFTPFLFSFIFVLIQAFLLLSLLTAMLLSTYMSEVKKLREAEVRAAAKLSAAEVHERDAAVNRFGSSDSASFDAQRPKPDNNGNNQDDLGEIDVFHDLPPGEEAGNIAMYEYYHRKWNQLSHLFLELTVTMNGIVHVTTEILRSS